MALPCPLHAVLRHALFTKVTPTNYMICHGQKQFQETSHALAFGRLVPGLTIGTN